jgi:hypothetical protein
MIFTHTVSCKISGIKKDGHYILNAIFSFNAFILFL